MSKRSAQRGLCVLWVGSFLLLALVVEVQSNGTSLWGSQATMVFEWLFRHLGPTFALMFGAVIGDARRGRTAEQRVDGFVAGLSFVVTGVFLVATVLAFVLASYRRSIEALNASNALLSGLWAVTSIVFGYFFGTSSEPSKQGQETA